MKALARRAMHRRLAWLALWAMAFVIALPSISRLLPMPGAMPGMAAMAHAHHEAARQPQVPSAPDDPLQRCGYCVLLAHSPSLGAGVFVPLLLPALRPLAPPMLRIVAVRVPPVRGAQARGPPLPA